VAPASTRASTASSWLLARAAARGVRPVLLERQRSAPACSSARVTSTGQTSLLYTAARQALQPSSTPRRSGGREKRAFQAPVPEETRFYLAATSLYLLLCYVLVVQPRHLPFQRVQRGGRLTQSRLLLSRCRGSGRRVGAGAPWAGGRRQHRVPCTAPCSSSEITPISGFNGVESLSGQQLTRFHTTRADTINAFHRY
jgi:hypothetical protein